MKTAIILGAGASKADGAPLQGELFREYFKWLQNEHRLNPYRGQAEYESELNTFFDLIFGLDVIHGDLDALRFPTFEEVLGIIDLGDTRKESLREFDLPNTASNSGRLLMMRVHLINMMGKILDEKLKVRAIYHKKLIEQLGDAGVKSSVILVSLNYDILIDNAIAGFRSRESGQKVDYGIELTNFTRELDWDRPAADAVHLHKVHGSLNWLYCSCCNTVTITPFEKGIVGLVNDFPKMPCMNCESVLLPIIVPPTFFKDMSNVFLSQIWANTERDLAACDHIIFCGYSFPDADIHIKYLLKRVQTNRRNRPPLQFTVINNYDKKPDEIKLEEEKRYKRFLGPLVNYLPNMSFQNFADDPIDVLRSEQP